ncbi:MAG TPA: Sip1-related alpha-galactosidase [Pyrinomonadaceae bacterium]|nr:Sip1-related alpha-galactosidase [Pyrinomonadaceae bacterium]
MLRRIVLLALFLAAACVAGRAQSPGQSNVSLNRGQLQLRRGPGLVMTVMRLRLRLADGAAVSGELEAAGRDAGSDAAGAFERERFRLKPNGDARGVKGATLEVRRYQNSGVLVAWLDYEGPALAPREGVQLVSSLDRFARGTATKRFKIYWTAPVFFSDYRLLGPANQLMLWRQTEGEDYHLLVPLAGGGMLGEVGVSEIEWRPEFRVTASSYDPDLAPRRVPLFAYAAGADPYALPRATYETAFAATGQYGRLRWQKPYPEVFRSLGWCSWNAYGQDVTAEKVAASVRSIREKNIPLGFVLVDDGWLSVRDQKLAAFEADASKFPGGMAALARRLREEYRVPHVGVWHTFQGYWNGVAPDSELERKYRMFKGLEGKLLPDPRDGRGQSFYEDWFRLLKGWGYDFVKVDGQGNNVKFTDGLMPLFDAGGGSHRNLQAAAGKFFDAGGLGLINCMEMSLENAYNWHASNVARSSDDYQPELRHNPKDHVYQNAYNAFWISNFAYPDWDMFQSHDEAAEYHAAARAVSGGPVYFTDEPGKERPEILKRLALADGRLLMADEPAQVTRDLLLNDPSVEPVPLKVSARVTRPGYTAGVVAAFNVNKTAERVAGALGALDAELPAGETQPGVSVYKAGDRSVRIITRGMSLPFELGETGFELFTVVSARGGVSVFGLLDKYLGPAGVVSVRQEGRGVTVVRLREAGDFGAGLFSPPARVEVDGRRLPPSAYTYWQGLLRVPRASFGAGAGEREVKIISRR